MKETALKRTKLIALIALFAALATGGAVVASQYLGRRDADSGTTIISAYRRGFISALLPRLCIYYRF